LGVFGLVSLLPVLFGHNPIALYTAYLETLKLWMSGNGGNSFAGSGQTNISLGLFKSNAVSLSIGAVLFAAFVLKALHETRRAAFQPALHAVFAMACLTLALVYHRIYDGVLVYPLLLLELALFTQRGDRANRAITGFFALLFALPGALFEKAGIMLGAALGENPVVHMPAGQFPLPSLLFLLLTVYSVGLYVFGTPSIPLGLRENPGAGNAQSPPNFMEY
jgi:hypothetical protein